MNYSAILRYNIALTCIRGMNLMLAKTLLGYTGNTENLFLESEKTLQSVSGIKSDIFSCFVAVNKEAPFVLVLISCIWNKNCMEGAILYDYKIVAYYFGF